LRIFLLQFCKISAILFFNLFQILDFDRNNLFTHFCFSELLILREKKIRGFFGPLEYQNKIKKFQKIWKKRHLGELLKKGTILHQAPQITLFFTHPVHFTECKL